VVNKISGPRRNEVGNGGYYTTRNSVISATPLVLLW